MAILSYEALQRRFESKPDLRDLLDTAYYWRTRPEPNKRQVAGKVQIDQPNTAKIVAGATNTSGTNGSQGTTGLPGTKGSGVTNITIGEAVAAISLPLNEVAFGGGDGQPLRSNPLFMTVPDGDKLHVKIENDILLGGDIRVGYDGFTIWAAGTDTMIFGPDIINIRRALQIGADPTEDAGGEGYDTVIWGDTLLKNSLIKPELPLFKAADGLLYSRPLQEAEAPRSKFISAAASTIMPADPVAVVGANAGELSVNLALSATAARSWMVGVADEDGAYPGQFGAVVRRGPVSLDTSAFTGAAGSQLWLQPAGGLNTTVPTINNATRKVNAGTLLVKAELGKIYVDPVNFPFVHELSGVNAAAPADKHALMFSTATNRWEARAVVAADVTGVEPAIAAGTTAQYWRGDKTWQTLNTSVVPELTNLYFTDARARATLSATTPLSYNSSTGVFTHLAGDGQLHVPATSTTNNLKFLQAGATAGSIYWTTITPTLIGAAPAFTSAGQGLFWATPVGSSGAPSLRAIEGEDLPYLEIAVGAKSLTHAMSLPFSFSLAEIGAAPAFTAGTQNLFWSTPSSGSGVPSLRAIEAVDIPTLNQNTTGSAGTLRIPRILTVGATEKLFDGSGDVAWSLVEIGAAPAFTSAAAGLFWATPVGSSGVPSLRVIGASDLPDHNGMNGTSAANAHPTRAITGLDFFEDFRQPGWSDTQTAQAAAASGQRVTVNGGSYTLTAQVVFASGSVFDGRKGATFTISGIDIPFIFSGVSDAGIKGCRINAGITTPVSYTPAAVYIDAASSDLVFSDNTITCTNIHNFSINGVGATSCDRITIKNNRIIQTTKSGRAFHVWMTGRLVAGNSGAINQDGNADTLIYGNKFIGAGNGLLLNGDGIDVSSNVFNGVDAPVACSFVRDLRITSNRLYQFIGNGLTIGNGTDDIIEGFIVSNNILRSTINTLHGINVYKQGGDANPVGSPNLGLDKRGIISGNSIYGVSANAGIFAYGNGDMSISGNNISGFGNGVMAAISATGVHPGKLSISGNEIQATSRGIALGSSAQAAWYNVAINGNQINAPDIGIVISRLSKFSITGNQIDGIISYDPVTSLGCAISMNLCSNGVVSGNMLSGPGEFADLWWQLYANANILFTANIGDGRYYRLGTSDPIFTGNLGSNGTVIDNSGGCEFNAGPTATATYKAGKTSSNNRSGSFLVYYSGSRDASSDFATYHSECLAMVRATRSAGPGGVWSFTVSYLNQVNAATISVSAASDVLSFTGNSNIATVSSSIVSVQPMQSLLINNGQAI